MTPYWERTDPADRLAAQILPVREITLPAVQEEVNFVVFAPTWLPADCRPPVATLRPEQPPGRPGGVRPEEIGQTPWSEGNPCSVRLTLTGHGRRLRLKQFLYDWAPPAASTAPLWNSPRLTTLECHDTVAWLGTDYLGRQGACVQLARTQVELSVEEGAFADDEIARLLGGLAPAAPGRDDVVRRALFHRLNYWVRYRVRPVAVPYGLWRYAHGRRYDRARIVAPDDLLQQAPVRTLYPTDGRYVLDSAVVIDDPQARHREVELVYRHHRNRSDHLWLVAMDRESDLALPIPPAPNKHPAARRAPLSLRGTTIWYAALDEVSGAWEALWEEDGVRYAVWAGSSRWLDGDGFTALIASLDTQPVRTTGSPPPTSDHGA